MRISWFILVGVACLFLAHGKIWHQRNMFWEFEASLDVNVTVQMQKAPQNEMNMFQGIVATIWTSSLPRWDTEIATRGQHSSSVRADIPSHRADRVDGIVSSKELTVSQDRVRAHTVLSARCDPVKIRPVKIRVNQRELSKGFSYSYVGCNCIIFEPTICWCSARFSWRVGSHFLFAPVRYGIFCYAVEIATRSRASIKIELSSSVVHASSYDTCETLNRIPFNAITAFAVTVIQ